MNLVADLLHRPRHYIDRGNKYLSEVNFIGSHVEQKYLA